jgi:hypothetical protein
MPNEKEVMVVVSYRGVYSDTWLLQYSDTGHANFYNWLSTQGYTKSGYEITFS